MNPFPNHLAIVDIETTGLNSKRDRIIELAILRIEHNKLVESFSSLVNPEMSLPQDIELLTGIRRQDLDTAPRFYDIAREVQEFLADAVFVAHNARFDYSFIKHEFARYEIPFRAKELCTVRLFRAVSPGRRHNLDTLIESYGISVDVRHRALSDAKVLWEFLRILTKNHKPTHLARAIDVAMRKPSLPNAISPIVIEKIPETTGVYSFLGEGGTPLYIGKSINMKNRVLSHFQDAHHSAKELKIREQVREITYTQTTGELSALLLESELIKHHRPMYNRLGRYTSKLIGVQTTYNDNKYMCASQLVISTIDPDSIATYIGIFRSKTQAEKFLRDLGEKYKLCLKLLGIENSTRACFWYRLGWCKGACVGKELPARYNMRMAQAIASYKLKAWPFDGPVVIRESDGNQNHAIIVDKWCVIGNIRDGDEESGLTQHGSLYNFDLDTYRILKRYILNKNNQNNIRALGVHFRT